MNFSFSQEGEDIILRELFANQKENGSYLDIGAFHPMHYSNTYYFYLNGWRGVNVDATPGKMKVFNKYRPYDINLETGVAHSRGSIKLYRFEEGALDTCDESRLEHLAKCGYTPIDVISIETVTINDILNKYFENKVIDLLDIDVEGLDEEIIKDIDFTKFKPKVLLTEIFDDKCPSEINNLLADNGYRLAAKTMRTGIYCNKDFFSNFE